MSERSFRLLLGGALLLFLFFELNVLVFLYIGLVFLEGVTNWRIPLLISKLRYGSSYTHLTADADRPFKYHFEAERVLRVVIAFLLTLSFVLFPQNLWFLSWFVGFGLCMAGITGICPMAIFMRKLGFR